MFGRLNCRLGRHTWGPWEPDVDVQCLTIRFCEYCHRKEVGISRHRFTPWEYVEQDGESVEKRQCLICRQQETRPALPRVQSPIGDAQSLPIDEPPMVTAVAETATLTLQETDVDDAQGAVPPIELPTLPTSTLETATAEVPAAQAAEEKPRKKKRKTKEVQAVVEAVAITAAVAEAQSETMSRALMIIPQPPAEVAVTSTKPRSRKRKSKGTAALDEIGGADACDHHTLLWASVATEPCLREFKCQECGHVAETQENHKWFLTYRSERGTEHYTCEVCHKTMVRN